MVFEKNPFCDYLLTSVFVVLHNQVTVFLFFFFIVMETKHQQQISLKNLRKKL